VLKKELLWHLVDPKKPLPFLPDTEENRQKNKITEERLNQAHGTIALALDPPTQLIVRECENGRDAWQKLCAKSDLDDRRMKHVRYMAFLNLKQRPDESAEGWTSRVTSEHMAASNQVSTSTTTSLRRHYYMGRMQAY
jgi:hypothetical protein